MRGPEPLCQPPFGPLPLGQMQQRAEPRLADGAAALAAPTGACADDQTGTGDG